VNEPSRPDILITRIFDFHFDLLWFLFPMFIFRPFFERHFLNLIQRQVVVNLSRLSAQWEMGINRAIEDLRKQATGYIRDELATLDALISQSRGQTEAIRALLKDLEEARGDGTRKGP